MAYNNNSESKSGWQEKVKHYLKIAIAIALVIWIFSMANGAQNLAHKNKEIVKVPEFKISYVSGGAERFPGYFKEIENVEPDEIEKDNYLWSSVIVQNIGEKDDEDIEFTINSAVPVDGVFIAPSGYSNEVEVNLEDDKKTAEITMEKFDEDEEAYIFIAMQPPGFNKPYSIETRRKWADTFDTYLEKIQVESDMAENSKFINGYSALYK